MDKTDESSLADMIKKAIDDGELTESEYMAILARAEDDQHVDPHEQRLLGQLHALIANQTVRRVAG